MKRYTEKNFGMAGYYMACSDECSREDFDCTDCYAFEQLVDRLGAYEDTGLEPEQLADAVPVVRCRDCLNSRPLNRNDREENDYIDGCIWCTEWQGGVLPDEFCSRGMRKDG